jgi:hypothetical protein
MAMFCAAQFVLAAPVWMVGLGVLAVPLVLHLWSRRTGPPAPFPSIRMLRAIYTERARRSRWRDLLVMLLRCALLGLIVLAFAQPRWQTAPQEPPLPAAGTGEVRTIVLDASASMQRPYRGGTLFDEAKRLTARFIRSVGPQTPVSVIVLGGQATPLLPRPTTHHTALLDRLDAVTCSDQHGALAMAVGRATGRAGGGQVIFITDGQRTSWPEEPDPTWPPVTTIAVGDATDAPNTAVENLRITPRSMRVGEPATVSFDVVRYGRSSLATTVSLTTAQRSVVRDVALEGGQRLAFNIPATFLRSGLQELVVQLPGDALPLDDTVRTLVHVRGPVVLAAAASTDNANRAGHYVAQAIAERAGPLDQADAVVVADAEALTGGQRDAVRQFIATGGSAIAFVDSPEDAKAIGWDASVRALDGVATLEPVDTRVPPWAVFEGRSLATLRAVRFERRTTIDAHPDIVVLARWSDGRPAAALTRLGAGHLVVVLGGIDPAASTLTDSPAFLPLIHELAHFMQPDGQGLSIVTAGSAAQVPVTPRAARDGLRVVGPDGQDAMSVVEVSDGQALVGVDAAERIGLYRILNDKQQIVGGFTAGIDARESDLQRMPRLTGSAEVLAALTATPAAQDTPNTPTTVPLWPWVLIAALAVGVAEQIAAGTARPPARGHRAADPWFDEPGGAA